MIASNKTKSQRQTKAGKSQYSIGAVAKLTGLSPQLIRAWELRYAVVTPNRSEKNRRLYSQTDVDKLRLLKTLTETGQPISTLAKLSLAQLNKRLVTDMRDMQGSDYDSHTNIIVVGASLSARIKSQKAMFPSKLSGVFRDLTELDPLTIEQSVDILVLEYPCIYLETGREVRHLMKTLRAKHAIVLYAFSASEALQRLKGTSITVKRAPVSLDEISGLIRAAGQIAVASDPPATVSATGVKAPPMFTPLQLAHIAQHASVLKCECPPHLVDLITSLANFEAYSAECESRSVRDAALHRYLGEATGLARELVEGALQRLVETEGLDIDP
ncbi:MAG: MerR family transcriptional regulator [Gammaproteobacteria bacterium]|nr:MerR family transcriptional regulator [Gammaproteobacteria bacterium]